MRTKFDRERHLPKNWCSFPGLKQNHPEILFEDYISGDDKEIHYNIKAIFEEKEIFKNTTIIPVKDLYVEEFLVPRSDHMAVFWNISFQEKFLVFITRLIEDNKK